MLNPKVYESNYNILFIPTIKLTNEMFPRDISDEDKRKIFLIIINKFYLLISQVIGHLIMILA